MMNRQVMLDAFRNQTPDAKTLSIERIPQFVANSFYIDHHYLHRGRQGSTLDYGVSIGPNRIGCITFAYPMWHSKEGLVPTPYRNGQVVELARMCFIPPALHGIEHQALRMAFERMPSDWLALNAIEPKVIIAYVNVLKAPVEQQIYIDMDFKVWGSSTHKKSNKLAEDHMEYGKQRTKAIFIRSLAREWGK